MKKTGYTLIEIMVVVVLLGIVAGFALPNYSNYIRQAEERDAVAQLQALDAANRIYRAQTNSYYENIVTTDIRDVNNELRTNLIISTNKSFFYTGDATTYSATIFCFPGQANDFGLQISENSSTPCCSRAGGACPTSTIPPC